jgi:hypothetical protein
MAEETKSSISKDLVSKYGGVNAATAQIEKDRLLKQQQTQQDELSRLKGVNVSNIDQSKHQAHYDQISAAQRSLSGTQSQIAAQSSVIADPTRNIEAKQRDIIKGAQFGEAVLGDGLGRMGEQADVQQAMGQLREQSQGFSGAEALARREQAVGQLNTKQQGMERALQAKLARAGVRGGAAGAQIRDTALAGMQQRSNLERDLFLAGEDARRSGTQAFAKAAGEVATFDIGQAAKEKNIVLQSGLGFAQLGAAERGAKLQAQASQAAANAQAASACHTGNAEVLMEDGTYKRIDEIKIGDRVELGGKVKIIGQAEADAHIYQIGDGDDAEFVTASHVIEYKGKYTVVSALGFERTLLPSDTIVYPMATENGCYITKSGLISGDLLTEENEEGISFKVARKASLR